MHAVMLTYSRGAMLSVIVGVPAMLVCARQRRLLGAFVLVSATIAIPMMAGKEVRERFFTVSKYNVDESVGVRFASWRAAYNMAWDYPVFGVGVRNSNLFSFRYGADMEGRTIHSQYLQIAADSGWIGLTFYLLTAMMSLWGAYRVKSLLGRHADGEGRIANAIAGGSICSLILFFFGAAFLSVEVFELPYLLIFLAAQLRLLVNPAEQISEWLPQSDAPSSALPVAV
jgi:O-antigen ligase